MDTSIQYLRLYLHHPSDGRQAIGYLSRYGDIMRASFAEEYINNPARLTLSMAYRGATDAATQQILRATRDERLVRNDSRWPTYFENLLPEGHNRDRLAAQRGCSSDDSFQLLAAAGLDLMGAVEVAPVPQNEEIPHEVKHWHVAMGLDVLEPGFVEMPVEDATALGGAVTKFSAVQDGRRYVVRREGEAGSFILKLPSTRHPDLVANEYTGYQLCKALDLDCATASVISRKDADLPEEAYFDEILAVQRYDRRDGRRVHMEEFAQALGYMPGKKYGKGIRQDYGTMLRFLDAYSTGPARDVREFLHRFVAFILMGNVDAHLKNWALLYPDGKEPELAPLYDPVCVSAFFAAAPPKDYAFNRAIDVTLRAFTWEDLLGLVKEANLLRPGAIVRSCHELVRKAQADWPAILAHAPENMRQEVTARLNGSVALTR